MKARTKTAKMDLDLFNEFQRIAAVRVATKRDQVSRPPMVQRKLLKHRLWPDIRRDLEIAEFLKDDRGQVDFGAMAIFRFIIVTFVTVLLFGGLIYVMGILNTTMHNVGIPNDVNSGKAGYVNLTRASDQTFGQANSSIQALRLVALTLIFSEILFFFVMLSFRRVHAAMFFVYILIVFLAVMFAAPVSNSYQTLLSSTIYGGNLQSFTGANWILLNLPMVTLFVGIVGSIFLFINIARVGGDGIIP